MKYVMPTFEIMEIETEDVIAASSKYEVEQTNDGGNVIFNAANIFG